MTPKTIIRIGFLLAALNFGGMVVVTLLIQARR